MFTTHSAAWDAKNRFGLAEELPMEFGKIAHLFSGGEKRDKTTAGITPPAVVPAAKPAPAKAQTPAPVEEPDLTPPESTKGDDTIDHAVTVPEKIENWLDKHAATVNAYCQRVGWISAGQTWRNLAEEKQELISAKPEKFARAASIAALA